MRGAELLCPVCDAAMTTLERAGVEIEMCPRCRGVWLDRGELEKLIQREGDDDRGFRDDRREYRRHSDDGYKHTKKKSKFSILSELFD